MRVARVLTNETCNQNCSFCDTRRPREDPRFVAAAAVRDRIDAAIASGAQTLILTGGEPTMRRDLAQLVAHARRDGVEIVLETNASLISSGIARELAQAGLARARVHLPGWGEGLERINRDPGSFEATLRGARALAEAGISLEVAVPVVRDNAHEVLALPERVRESGLAVENVVIFVPNAGPDEAALLSPQEAAAAVQGLEAAARREDFAVRLDHSAFLAPCFFERPARLSHLYSLTPGGGRRPGYRQLPGCEPCVVADRCPGIADASLARDPTLAPRPIVEDRVRRRLAVISTVEEQLRRELAQDDVFRGDDGSTIPARIVRVNFRCNQACHFCFVSTHLPSADEPLIRAEIEQAGADDKAVVISGGEPTLNPHLLDYVRLARSSGARYIELQTNALRLGEGSLARDLVEAGVDTAFVSLHGSRAEVSDRVTDAPGTFAKTVRGIDAWRETGKSIRINFVFCRHNLADFPDYIRMVGERWPGITVVVSFVAPSTDVVPRTEELIPRYRDVLPSLAEGLREAQRLGLEVVGFESMCGIPLCLVPADVEPYFALAQMPEQFDRGEFVKAEACASCALDGRCFGVRRGYAQMYGTDEFRPVE